MSKSIANYRLRIVCVIINGVDMQTVWGEVMAVHRWNWKAAGAGELNVARHGPVRYMPWKCIATLREYRN